VVLNYSSLLIGVNGAERYRKGSNHIDNKSRLRDYSL